MEDLDKYKVKWKDPVRVTFKNNVTLYTSPLPSGGSLVAFILNIMDGYNVTEQDRATLRRYAMLEHRMVEAEKFAYAHRPLLGDPDFTDVTRVRY